MARRGASKPSRRNNRKKGAGASRDGRGRTPKSIGSTIENVDRSDLLADYDYWPELALKVWNETAIPSDNYGEVRRVILAGMGGSLLTGELIVDLAREKRSKLQFETIKDYHIPDSCDGRTLVLGLSSSGNTEETLSVLSESHKAGVRAVSFGTGGALETLSKEKWGFDFVRTSMLKVPRSSLPGIFYAVLKFLIESGLIPVSGAEVEESMEALRITKDRVRGSSSHDGNSPLQIARKFLKEPAFPLVYSSNRTRGVGLRFRQSINENAKMHAFNGEIPELCHNDIVGWDAMSSSVVRHIAVSSSGSKAVAMFLRLRQDDPIEVRERFDIVDEIVKKAGGETIEAPSTGNCYLARAMSMLYQLDYATYYMAILRNIDPIMTPSINLLKQELATRLKYASLL